MPTYVVTDSGQLALKGGGGWKRVRLVTVTGDASTYQATGFAITTANVKMPISITGLDLIATSGAVVSDATYDYVNSTMRMYLTAGGEFGTANSTAFTTASVIKIIVYGT